MSKNAYINSQTAAIRASTYGRESRAPVADSIEYIHDSNKKAPKRFHSVGEESISGDDYALVINPQ